MAWYLVTFFIGVVVGLIVEDRISTDVTINGKVKQRGENNRLFLNTALNTPTKSALSNWREKRAKKREERRQKRIERKGSN